MYDTLSDDAPAATFRTPILCAHCGLLAGPKVSATPWFCCAGCATVFQVLQSAGLGRFYDLKRDGVCIRPAAPVVESDVTFNNWQSFERNHKIYLEGVHCSACLWLIEKLPEMAVADVAEAHLDLGHSILRLKLTHEGSLSAVAQLLNSWGYRPHLIQSQEQGFELEKKENRSRLIDLGVAGALAGNIMLMTLPLYAGANAEWSRFFSYSSAALSALSVGYSGRSFFHGVWASFRQKRFSIDAPIMLAIVVAFFYSLFGIYSGRLNEIYFDSLSSLIFLLLASRYLLSRLRQYGLGESHSHLFVNADENRRVGERFALNPGFRLDIDGLIRTGRGFFNNSTLTGESEPVEMRPGDLVFAGAIYDGAAEGSADVEVEVRAVGRDTRLEQILSEVRNQNQKRTAREQQYDSYAKALLILVSIVAVGILIYFGLQNKIDIGLHRALALLIVTCPCALALATPLAQALFLKKAFAWGLLVRDVESLENANSLDVICFDKTGTLTEGRMRVLENEVPAKFFGKLRALAHASRHPVSRAIAAHLGLGQVEALSNLRDILGVGIEATIAGKVYFLGRTKASVENEKRILVDFLEQGAPIGRLYLADQVRPEAAIIVRAQQARGLRCQIVSGDRETVAQDVANQIGIAMADTFANCSPELKAQKIDEIKAQGQRVAVVGDGVNDALAMSHADVSIAVQGGLGAIQSAAGVAVLRPGLAAVTDFFFLGRKLQQMHRINFIFSTLYNSIAGGLAIAGLMNPLIAAIVMPLSALTVFISTFLFVRHLKGGQS